MNPIVRELSNVTINTDIDDEDELVLNENLALEYVLSHSIDASNNKYVLIKRLNKTPALQILVHSGLPNDSLIGDHNDAMLIVRAKHNQSPIIFGKSTSRP